MKETCGLPHLCPLQVYKSSILDHGAPFHPTQNCRGHCPGPTHPLRSLHLQFLPPPQRGVLQGKGDLWGPRECSGRSLHPHLLTYQVSPPLILEGPQDPSACPGDVHGIFSPPIIHPCVRGCQSPRDCLVNDSFSCTFVCKYRPVCWARQVVTSGLGQLSPRLCRGFWRTTDQLHPAFFAFCEHLSVVLSLLISQDASSQVHAL